MVAAVPARGLVAAGLVFLAVALGVVALSLVVEWLAEGRRRREVARQLRALETGPGPGVSVVRGEKADDLPWLRPITEKLPQLKDVDHLLQQAALSWSFETYLLLTAGFALALGLGGLIAFGFLVALPLAALGAYLPYAYVRRKRTKRFHRFEEQLPDAVDLVGRALRAGHPLSAGFRMVAEESPEPVAGEFRQVFEEQRFGLPYEDSMASLADRMPLVDVRILITATLIQREVGGNLAEVLDKIAYIIRQRFTIRRQLRVITAEGRMSMWVLLALPPFMFLVIFLLNPGYMLTLVRDPVGPWMMLGSVVMNVVGGLWIRKIVNIDI